ncbi:lysophospholipid acyltransferase family protein [Bacillota bacterium LX-D]|nr:lysophospholipid acyltransferase family protein [Bacillota bacterium LX-D]
MLRTLFWFIYFWIFLILVLPDLIKVRSLDRAHKIQEKDRAVDQIVKKWARSLVNLTGSKVTVTGAENIPSQGSVVFISNHQGNFDIPILLGFIDKPKAFIAKKELKKMPFISSWMRYMNCIFMDRSSARAGLKAIQEGIAVLRKGYSLVIFPEGTRSRGNQIGEFKPGSFKLALKAGVPIVPVTIKGSYNIMETNGWMIKPANVQVIISEPVSITNLSKEETDRLPEKVKNIIASKL